MGGGGESAEGVFRAMKQYLAGHDPARIEEMRFLIANPTASLYNNRTQVRAALEFACLNILGPIHETMLLHVPSVLSVVIVRP
jgi:glucarate dehydratase